MNLLDKVRKIASIKKIDMNEDEKNAKTISYSICICQHLLDAMDEIENKVNEVPNSEYGEYEEGLEDALSILREHLEGEAPHDQ
jgi:protein associated with RNAse G/E